jgi:hypothetical protein
MAAERGFWFWRAGDLECHVLLGECGGDVDVNNVTWVHDISTIELVLLFYAPFGVGVLMNFCNSSVKLS